MIKIDMGKTTYDVWNGQKNIRYNLVSFDNPRGGIITNLDLDQVALILQESMFPIICSDLVQRVPLTYSNNTPTVA